MIQTNDDDTVALLFLLLLIVSFLFSLTGRVVPNAPNEEKADAISALAWRIRSTARRRSSFSSWVMPLLLVVVVAAALVFAKLASQ